MRRFETFTFYHQPVDGGPQVTSSCAAPAPADPAVAHGAVCELPEITTPATQMVRHTLDYPQLPPGTEAEGLQTIINRYDNCARCHLSGRRFRIVFVRGNLQAPVVALGEGPGKDEDAFGSPFVGKSGRLQDTAFEMFGIDPENDLAWMNSIGCRSRADNMNDDRKPLDAELIACSERTLMLLRVLRPRIVICLGKVATRMFWDEAPQQWSWASISDPAHPQDTIVVGYAYHPAYLARVIGGRAGYREFAAARTFYGILKQQLATQTVTKVSTWWHVPQYLKNVTGPVAGT